MRSEENFEKIKTEANGLMEKCGIDSHFNASRKFPTIDDFYKYLKCDVFYPMHDRILNELEITFDDILETCQLFSALEPKKNFLKKGNDEQPKHLCNTYEKDVDSTSVQFVYPALMITETEWRAVTGSVNFKYFIYLKLNLVPLVVSWPLL